MEPHAPQADLALEALGSRTRRDILALLRVRPMTVGSKHLKILQQAGLVSFDPRGRRNIFFLQPAGFREVQGYLDQFWDEALASLKGYVDDQGQPGR